MKIREFFTNPYILFILIMWSAASFFIAFYISWALTAAIAAGAVGFFLYVSMIYRFVLHKEFTWVEKRDDELFMSLWYSWPVYLLTCLLLLFLADELWALAVASGGAAGIVIGEFVHLRRKNKKKDRPMKLEA